MRLEVQFVFLVTVLGRLSFGQYARRTCYSGEVLVKCFGLKREALESLMEAEGVDVWYVGVGGSVDMRMSGHRFRKMKGRLPGCREEASVERLVKQARMLATKQAVNQAEQGWFENYHRYEEIVTWYSELAQKFPALVKFEESIGESIEGRKMPAIHITATRNSKKFFFQCQIHAREWISGATCSFIANYLVENYNKKERVTKLLDKAEFIILPFANPDGYAVSHLLFDAHVQYTWSNDRLWRKNRRRGTKCDGVDLNRNFPDHWAEGGSSTNLCSEVYHGTSAASEPEVRAITDYFRNQTSTGNPVIGVIDWHSYSQLILRPYGWTAADVPDEDRLRALGNNMSESIYSMNRRMYISQKTTSLYPATGTAEDWFYSDNANELNGEVRPAVFTIELPDNGFYGFLLPPQEIVPTGEEAVAAVLTFAESLIREPLKKKARYFKF